MINLIRMYLAWCDKPHVFTNIDHLNLYFSLTLLFLVSVYVFFKK